MNNSYAAKSDVPYFACRGETVNLLDRNEVQDYLDHCSNHANFRYDFVYMDEVVVIGINDQELFYPTACHQPIITDGVRKGVINIDPYEKCNEYCIKEGPGQFMAYQDATINGYRVLPVAPCGYPSLLDRAGMLCVTMKRLKSKDNKLALPADERGDWINRAFQLQGCGCKIFVFDGEVNAVLSEQYDEMPPQEVTPFTEKALISQFPHMVYARGFVSEAYLVLEYNLNDIIMAETIRADLNAHGADIRELEMGVQISTSNIGLAAATARFYFVIDGTRVWLADRVRIPHKGGATSEGFAKACENLGTLAKESEDKIESLGNVDINDVSKVVREIGKNTPWMRTAISEAVADELALTIPNGGTAIDCYLALNDIVQRMCGNEFSATQYLNYCDQVAQMMNLPFDKIDRGEYKFSK